MLILLGGAVDRVNGKELLQFAAFSSLFLLHRILKISAIRLPSVEAIPKRMAIPKEQRYREKTTRIGLLLLQFQFGHGITIFTGHRTQRKAFLIAPP